MTVGEVLRRASGYLERPGVENPRLDAELLLGRALGPTRLELYLEHDRPLNETELASCRELVERRGKREPLAYVLGEWGFRRLTLKVDRRVLVPRPETEVVVERWRWSSSRASMDPRVLDVGTGQRRDRAGDRRRASRRARDRDRRLRRCARGRARERRAPRARRRAARGATCEVAGAGPDLVVSNPPYVAAHELEGLQPEVRREPAEALVGDGLHGEIARRARTSWLVLEVGDGQAQAVVTS